MYRLLVGAAFIAAFFVAPVTAQPACGLRDAIVARLRSGYQEDRRSAGIAANGDLVEVFVSQTGTWTILVTRPGGPSCVVSVGNSWQRDDVSEKRDGV